MLIRFTVENFLSFKDETEFSMIPGKGTNHNKHVIKPKNKTGIPLLSSGIIYGANASGKSNLIKAVDEAKKIILKSINAKEILPDFRFKLNEKNKKGVTKFEFEIRANDKTYAYGFSFSPKRIEEEWLFIIKGNNETPVFERTKDKLKLNDKVIKARKEHERFGFIAEDLFPNQLFLSIANNRNISSMKYSQSFIDVYKWFEKSLIIIFPDSKFFGHPLWIDENNISKFPDFLLNSFDTGITKIEFKEIPFDKIYKKIPETIIEDIKLKLRSDGNIIISNQKNDMFYFTKSENEIKIKELVSFHNNNKSPFELSEESDGTNRLIDILPLILLLKTKNNNTILIDEIDRSLHTELTYKFMDLFLNFAARNKTQLVATTHDTALLDLELYRKDEIWFIEKDKEGASKIYSLDQFSPRADLNIRNGYLKGRFGAIPFFGNGLDAFVKNFEGAK